MQIDASPRSEDRTVIYARLVEVARKLEGGKKERRWGDHWEGCLGGEGCICGQMDPTGRLFWGEEEVTFAGAIPVTPGNWKNCVSWRWIIITGINQPITGGKVWASAKDAKKEAALLLVKVQPDLLEVTPIKSVGGNEMIFDYERRGSEIFPSLFDDPGGERRTVEEVSPSAYLYFKNDVWPFSQAPMGFRVGRIYE